MSKNTETDVFLGFAEDQLPWLLTNKFFPSKIGGKPAWLELQNLPETKFLLCEYCNEPCILLCQINAASKRPHAFHRTIFVFCCTNGKCSQTNQSGNIRVLRSQLGLKNQFYPDTPADRNVESPEIKPLVSTCRVCGCRGPLACGKCRKVNYCGPSHQKVDWKIHKQFCGQENDDPKTPMSEILFPEYEIDIEEEEPLDDEKKETENEAEARRMKEYEELVKTGKVGAMNEISDKELDEFAESKEDKNFGRFKKNIEGYETQVIRYHRHGSPLWISDHGILNAGFIPNCESCGSKRTFEFQIMPQMLNELKNYELDWGIIAIFTCEKDCDINGKYVTEFCYKQDIVKSEEDENNDIDMEKLEKLKISDKFSTPESSNSNKQQKEKKISKNHNEKSKKVSNSSQQQKKVQKAFDESDDW